MDLVAVRAAVLDAGAGVAMVTQPYRVAGPAARRRRPGSSTPPGSPSSPSCAAGWPVDSLVVGGRSSGARVACRTAVEAGADRILALAFPLHPPGRPETSPGRMNCAPACRRWCSTATGTPSACRSPCRRSTSRCSPARRTPCRRRRTGSHSSPWRSSPRAAIESLNSDVTGANRTHSPHRGPLSFRNLPGPSCSRRPTGPNPKGRPPGQAGRNGRRPSRALHGPCDAAEASPVEGSFRVAILEREDRRIRELLFSPAWPAATDAEPDPSWQPIVRERLTGATNSEVAQQLGVSSAGRSRVESHEW